MNLLVNKSFSLVKKNFENLSILKNDIDQSSNKDQIKYSKYNPFLFKKQFSKKKNNWYIFLKLSLVILMTIFGLLCLWYTTQWKNSDALKNLGIDLNKFTNIRDYVSENNLKKMSTMSIMDFDSISFIKPNVLDIMMAFSLVGLIFTIPTLIFKNGTISSLISLTIILSCLVIAFTLLVLGLIDQQNIINVYKDAKLDGFKSESLAQKLIELIKKDFWNTGTKPISISLI